MKQKKQIVRLTNVLDQVKSVFPFTQQPPIEEKKNRAPEESSRLQATDLFSCFTADIIKQEALFTR